jgi:hypothetical protein
MTSRKNTAVTTGRLAAGRMIPVAMMIKAPETIAMMMTMTRVVIIENQLASP